MSAIPLLDHVRAIKTEKEIETMRKSVEILTKTLEMVKGFLRVGVSEGDVARFVEKNMKRCGTEALAFPTIVAFGKHAAEIHHVPTKAKLKKNQVVMLDYGAVVKGYCSDMTRTLFFGTPDTKFLTWYPRVLEAQEYAIAKIRNGVRAHTVDHAARFRLEKFSNGRSFAHGTGHGVGLVIHEWPYLRVGSKDILKKNMVVTVEPGVYIKGWGGIRIEDMVVVKKKGCVLLTRSAKALEDMVLNTD